MVCSQPGLPCEGKGMRGGNARELSSIACRCQTRMQLQAEVLEHGVGRNFVRLMSPCIFGLLAPTVTPSTPCLANLKYIGPGCFQQQQRTKRQQGEGLRHSW
jgi:hypothetical protein